MELLKPTGFKKMIDPDGTFQILIPPNWRYWIMEGGYTVLRIMKLEAMKTVSSFL